MPRLLDCTLRDGSYVVDFQFTAEDTAVIAAGLESAGVEFIELGHGLGLHASESGKGRAAVSDEAYLRAARDSLHQAKWGMFFIPGIGRHEDLDLARRYGMHFVRIGANAPEVATTRDYVAHARDLGFHVWVNLMKSYSVPPDELVRLAVAAESFGAHTVALVDSAGTMLPDDVRSYVSQMRAALSVPVGFHGHDNLSLAMANVLAAIEAGAEIVDTTLQGIGRGGGNAVTEILVAILLKQGVATGIDVNRLMNLSERIVRPLLRGKGHDPIDITAGYAGFHSSYLQLIFKHAERCRIDPRELIVEVSGVDRVEVTEPLVERVANDIKSRQSGRSGTHVVQLPAMVHDAGEAGASLADAAAEVARQTRVIATKSGRTSVFNVVAARPGRRYSSVSPFIQEDFGYVIGSAEIHDTSELLSIAAAVDGIVDLWLADTNASAAGPSLASVLKGANSRSRVLAYRDDDVWARAIEHQVGALWGDRSDGSAVICGAGPLAARVALALAERDVPVVLTGDGGDSLARMRESLLLVARHGVRIAISEDEAAAARGARVLVAFGSNSLTLAAARALPAGAIVLDAYVGAIAPEVMAGAVDRQIIVLRPDMRAALAAEIATALGTERIARELMGRAEIDGVCVVAGGVVGRTGDVVVDSITNPSRVLGLADGAGSVIYGSPPDAAARLAKVQHAIWRRKLGAETRQS